ncbi:hypothetical protein AB6A40_001058 [Gnathostoma spinigerum]|uniref:RING-CH-type domain-containing protein n=1 Tax=Gnathostoma spinigerum TaxID=75299 RepID=A0ABD6E857_9BILA
MVFSETSDITHASCREHGETSKEGEDEEDTEAETSAARVCKFCYSDETVSEWLSPCRCSGSIKWVHSSCLDKWFSKASVFQQSQCMTCKYHYRKQWKLKPLKEWSRPQLHLSLWEIVEIIFDAYSTYRFCFGIYKTIHGQRSVLTQMAHFIFWSAFIANDQRLAYYSNLSQLLASSVVRVTVLDAK